MRRSGRFVQAWGGERPPTALRKEAGPLLQRFYRPKELSSSSLPLAARPPPSSSAQTEPHEFVSSPPLARRSNPSACPQPCSIPPSHPPLLIHPGDWNCALCKTHNFASRHMCYRCHVSQPQPPLPDLMLCLDLTEA